MKNIDRPPATPGATGRTAVSAAVVSAALLGLGLSAPAAQASVVFDNGAPDQVYGVNMNANVVAEDFTLAATIDVSSLRFWSIQASTADYGGTIGWSILSDVGGAPGAVQVTGSAAPTATATGASTGFGYAEYVFDIPTSFQLGAGSYWLSLASTPLSPALPVEMLWETTAAGSGSTAQYFDADLSGWYDTGSHLAFNITGTEVIPTVPEPSSLALLAAGLLAVGAARRRA